jgi:hypothetical protein
MAWTSEGLKNFLEITSIRENSKDYVHCQEYTPKKHWTDISVGLSDMDEELRIKPYTLESLNNQVNLEYSGGIVNQLIVGIRDQKSIMYVGKIWTPNQLKEKRINQYFFRDDQPSSFNFGNVRGPGWPLNQSAVLDNRLLSYFEELSKIRSGINESLGRCLNQLIIPGPEYTGKPGEGISVKFNLKSSKK